MASINVLAKTVVASSALFAVLLLALHAIQPDLDPTWNFISEYARGDQGWMMSLAFASLGVTCVSALLLFWPIARGWLGKIGLFMLAVSAIGMVLAALFVTDPINTPMDKLSTSGTLRSMGGQLNMTTFAMLFLTLSLLKLQPWKAIKWPLWIITIFALVADVAFIGSAASAGGTFGPGDYAGLFGRLVMLGFVAWMVVAGMHVLKNPAAATRK